MPPPRDWTTGPAKWAAVAVLGAASLGGLYVSLFHRERGTLHPSRSPRAEAAEAPPPSNSPLTPVPGASAREQVPSRIIDLNTASAAELDLLPGVGPALAARIIDYRREHGPFTSVDQLDNVKGIGPRTLEKLRPLVKVEPVQQAAPAEAAPPP